MTYYHTLEEAAKIAKERQESYGDFRENFADVSAICKTAFGIDLSPTEIIKVMIAVKLSREKHKPKHDNMIDTVNYAAMLATPNTPQTPPE